MQSAHAAPVFIRRLYMSDFWMLTHVLISLTDTRSEKDVCMKCATTIGSFLSASKSLGAITMILNCDHNL